MFFHNIFYRNVITGHSNIFFLFQSHIRKTLLPTKKQAGYIPFMETYPAIFFFFFSFYFICFFIFAIFFHSFEHSIFTSEMLLSSISMLFLNKGLVFIQFIEKLCMGVLFSVLFPFKNSLQLISQPWIFIMNSQIYIFHTQCLISMCRNISHSCNCLPWKHLVFIP